MKRLIALILTVSLPLCILAVPATSYAFDVFGNACSNGGGDSAVCQDKGNGGTDPLTGQNGILITVANIVALVAGVVAVIVIIVAGWQYITSGGDASKVQAAKSTVIQAVVGLVIIGASDVIIGFVLSKV